MRLDKLTIGSPKNSLSHQFKNLKDVTIDFDQDHWVTVVIGWNGAGKSNVLEALAVIFRELISSKKPKIDFAFKLAYRMGSGDATRHIHIDVDPDRKKEPFTIHVATNNEAQGIGTLVPFIEGEDKFSAMRGKHVKLQMFLNAGEVYLPRYVFSYYSGESTRMHEVFRPYLESYDNKLRNGEDPGLKRLFYAMPVHSQFVLLAFLIQQTDVVREFLDDHLGLDPDEGIESVLFVLRQPPWKSKAPDGDARFWNARGVVRDFLARLYDIALAPIQLKRRVPISLWNEKELEFQYLYVKDIHALKRLVGDQAPAKFFRDLESTYVSELIEEVRIRVRLKKNDGSVTFRELSEGEQQLLTVLGLLRFTAEEESLFLLDEPDTHLNPRWCVDYLTYLKKFVGGNAQDQENSHVVFTTHNPLAIAALEKEQVQILRRDVASNQIEARQPEIAPKGMGFDGIITSDLFGLGSSLDKPTNNDLLELHKLSTKDELNEEEKQLLREMRSRLESLDFNFATPDRLEREFMRARFDLSKGNKFDDAILTEENKKKALEALVTSLLSSFKEEGK
jgi:predicted ATPase